MKLLSYTFLFFTMQFYGQDDATESIEDRIVNYCFENLLPVRQFDSLPKWKEEKFCTLLDQLALLEFNSDNIDFNQKLYKSVLNRLREMSSLFYDQGTPIILTSGLDSSYNAIQSNQDMRDDNSIIYISIGECIIPNSWHEGKEVFNAMTKKLIEGTN